MELPLPSGASELFAGQVSDRPERSGLPTGVRPGSDQFQAAFVPDYSGGTAPDLHRVPCMPGDPKKDKIYVSRVSGEVKSKLPR